MVIANKSLLKMVRRLAIQNELHAMRLRGVLVVAPVIEKPGVRPGPKA